LRGLMWEKYAAPINRAARLRGTNAANHFHATQVLYELFSYLAADLPGFDDVSRAPSLAAELKFYLDAKYMEKLRMEQLAERFGVHPNHLSRVFREAYHMAPKQYLQRLKLEKAARMLASSDVPVALVAESLGFEDQHAFSRAFKKYWGVSPTAHRRSDTTEFHQS
ncbi:MAG: helix-turn-helix transcriptional regulator, partial [Clostridia bacterium]|nr:helix-turn-helix transcriptional regulator [Clostridia bacterium]